ncbi:DUF5994 family protein [Herbidospora mongoliensis]|uniref:DUF5994 family protein n=1 Tax=Herbidospora mongoliensis TaxID=688067 RepID=UPI000AFF59F0|nr:DUF5994 family protein [Herbidospora mongoliensis]
MTNTLLSEPRISLNPLLDRTGTVDGAWWPGTRDATAELPGLISAVDLRAGRPVLRVGLYQEAWDHIPHRVPAAGREVRVGWFLSGDPDLIILSFAGIGPITLLVIPADTPHDPAAAALALAAAGTTGVRPADILRPPAPDEGTPGRDWESEGGHAAAAEPLQTAAT